MLRFIRELKAAWYARPWEADKAALVKQTERADYWRKESGRLSLIIAQNSYSSPTVDYRLSGLREDIMRSVDVVSTPVYVPPKRQKKKKAGAKP